MHYQTQCKCIEFTLNSEKCDRVGGYSCGTLYNLCYPCLAYPDNPSATTVITQTATMYTGS